MKRFLEIVFSGLFILSIFLALDIKKAQAATYMAADLIKDKTITLDSLTWKRSDGKDVETSKDIAMNSGDNVYPTDFKMTFNANTKLKNGDVIDFGRVIGGGRYNGSNHPANLSARTIAGLGVTDSAHLTLKGYDQSKAVSLSAEVRFDGTTNTDPKAPDFTVASNTYLGVTQTFKLKMEVPIANPSSTLAETAERVGEWSDYHLVTTEYEFSYPRLFAQMVETKGKTGDTGILPDHDVIIATKSEPNVNVSRAYIRTWISNQSFVGNLRSIMPDGSGVSKQGFGNTVVYQNIKYVTVPKNTAITDLSKTLAVGQQTVYAMNDGSFVAAINLGKLGTTDSYHYDQLSSFYKLMMTNNAWGPIDDTVANTVANNLTRSDNAIKGSILNYNFPIGFEVADQTVATTVKSQVFTNINGHTLDSEVGNYSATTKPTAASSDGQTVIKYKYVDEKGMPIAAIKTATGWGENDSGHAIEKYDYTAPKTITGSDGTTYNLVPDKSAGKGHVSGEFPKSDTNTSFTFVYKATPAADVVVKYQLPDGTELVSGDTLTGNEGQNYTTVAKNIPGYTLKAKPANANGKFSDTDQTVVYVYEPNTQKVNVTYYDDDLKKNVSTSVETGDSDSAGHIKISIPANYTYVSANGSDGALSSDKSTWDLPFDHDDDTDQSVTIHLKHQHKTSQMTTTNTVTYTIDAPGKAPDAKSDTINWDIDTDLVTNSSTYTPDPTTDTINSPSVTGWTAEQKSVTFSQDKTTTKPVNQNKTVHYDINHYKVVINYVDDSGHTLKTETKDVTYDQAMNIHADIPDGYDYIKMTSSDITFKHDGLTASWIVKKDGTLNIIVGNKAALPKAGGKSMMMLVVMGIVLTVFGLFIKIKAKF